MKKLEALVQNKISFKEMNNIQGGGECGYRCTESTNAYNGQNSDTSVGIYDDNGNCIGGWSTPGGVQQ
jgi:natural product precursor